jgi:DNA-binding NarL/FixJ family response regulator
MGTDRGLRLVVADPQPLFRYALGRALEATSGLVTVGSSGDESESALLADQARADVVLAEVRLARGSGLHLATRLSGTPPVIILTRQHEGVVLMDAAAAGAMGCISHAVGLQRLVELLGQFRATRFCLDVDRMAEILRGAARASRGQTSEASGVHSLTVREREILSRLATGAGDDVIADALYISRHTVRTHVGNILQKLGVHSRADAARLALITEADRASQPEVLHISGPGWERS